MHDCNLPAISAHKAVLELCATCGPTEFSTLRDMQLDIMASKTAEEKKIINKKLTYSVVMAMTKLHIRRFGAILQNQISKLQHACTCMRTNFKVATFAAAVRMRVTFKFGTVL